MNDETMNIIVEKVLENLQKREKQALVVFTGGALKYQDSLASLRRLQENNWNLKVVLSKSAEHVFTSERIKKELSLENVYLESENKGLGQLYENTSVLIIPTLTMNTVAKIALGIADNLTTNIVQRFIMEELPIVASRNAATPEQAYFLEDISENAPIKNYIHMFHDYLARLEDFGIHLVDAENIDQAVLQTKRRLNNAVLTGVSATQDERKTIDKKVITQSDVMDAKNTGNVLRVHAKSIITPLAVETASTIGVKIIKSGE